MPGTVLGQGDLARWPRRRESIPGTAPESCVRTRGRSSQKQDPGTVSLPVERQAHPFPLLDAPHVSPHPLQGPAGRPAWTRLEGLCAVKAQGTGTASGEEGPGPAAHRPSTRPRVAGRCPVGGAGWVLGDLFTPHRPPRRAFYPAILWGKDRLCSGVTPTGARGAERGLQQARHRPRGAHGGPPEPEPLPQRAGGQGACRFLSNRESKLSRRGASPEQLCKSAQSLVHGQRGTPRG